MGNTYCSGRTIFCTEKNYPSSNSECHCWTYSRLFLSSTKTVTATTAILRSIAVNLVRKEKRSEKRYQFVGSTNKFLGKNIQILQ